jgi:hypothetical protein
MSDRFFEKNFFKISKLSEDVIFRDVLFDRWESFISRKGFSGMDELIFYLRAYPTELLLERIGIFLIANPLELKINDSILRKISIIGEDLNTSENLKEITDCIQCFSLQN